MMMKKWTMIAVDKLKGIESVVAVVVFVVGVEWWLDLMMVMRF
jgi:hypothetical protein